MAEPRSQQRDNKTKKPGGVTGKGFLPGKSGNPNGRPKSLGPLIRADTKQGRDLVKVLIEISKAKRAPAAGRVSAIRTLLEYGWGKPPVAAPEDEKEWRKIAAEFLGCDESEVPELP